MSRSINHAFIPTLFAGIISSFIESPMNIISEDCPPNSLTIFSKKIGSGFLNFSVSDIENKLTLPLFVKPNNGGSSIGITICKQKKEMILAIEEAFKYDTEVILEECLEGREYTCGVIDYLGKPTALPVIEIVSPKDEFYDYKNKYDANGAKHIVPAKISQQLTKEIQSAALLAHKSLGCLDMSRSDFIVKDDRIYILELNTIPGMTQVSLFPESAKSAGIKFPDLLRNIIMSAYRREVKNG